MFQKYINRFVRPRWRIGILETSLERLLKGDELHVRWVVNPFHDRWFADPFILSVDKNEVTLLVEDYRYKEGKGRLSRIIVDVERNSIVSCKTILEGGHYSFPAILRKEGKIFVYPEQSREEKLELFEYDEEQERLSFVWRLSDEALVDAIIYKGSIFATIGEDANGKKLKAWSISLEPETRNLTLGSAAFGVVTEKELETYSFDECIARNAGNFFEVAGKIYRPAQECNRWYGNALSIQSYDNRVFAEIRRIPGIHTLNSYQGVTVVDKKVFPFKWIYKLLGKTDK